LSAEFYFSPVWNKHQDRLIDAYISTLEVVEQVTVRLFVSSMKVFKCCMQNKTLCSSYHGNSFTNNERERERERERKG